MTLFDLAPFGFVPDAGRSALQTSLLCLYLSQVSVAALENVPLINMLLTSMDSFPQAGSSTLWLHSDSLSRALLFK